MDLSDSQTEAVTHGQGPLLVTAGAGSGKTRTLTQRVIYLINSGISPRRIVAITFTNKAADEMRTRILANAKKARVGTNTPFIGTFHAFSASILRREAQAVGRQPNYVIFDDDDSLRLIKKVLKSFDLQGSKQYSAPNLMRVVSDIKTELKDVDTLGEFEKKVFEEYEDRLSQQNAFDFDDLIEKTVRLFQRSPAVLMKYQNKFDHVLVDEYQDINHAQYQLIKLLSGSHQNLSVVGDDQQSIYAFRGANIRTFLNFERDWPRAKIVHLGENYRSSGNIVKAAAGVIANNRLQIKKDLWTENPDGSLVAVIGAKTPGEEADIIAEKISGRGVKDSAVLYRTNAQSRALEQALNFHTIPYEIYGGVKFYERKEIKDILAPLRYASNPLDGLSRERIEKNFRKAVREELVSRLPKMGKQLGLMELIGYVLKTTDYFEYLAKQYDNAEDRTENVRELINFATEFKTLDRFLERVSLLQASDRINKSAQNAPVKLMTIHLAKGLEFDDVYIAGANEGVLPHHRSYFSDEDLEEERRLMYVAMTRAKDNLSIFFNGPASRFLYEIPPELIQFKRADDTTEEDIYLD
ncbi:MAG: UvrD-helicase domain-containing protein [Candidatus Colwellbacteria bacterium]|nr:UvrD-helicase domain-containing protein [Candidatus Colwellbacteria bacterium]